MTQDNKNKNYIDISLFYKTKEDNANNVRILGTKFIENNKDKAKIIFNGTEYELKEYFKDISYDYVNKEGILLKLRIFEDITDMSEMFYDCDELYSFPEDNNIEESIDNDNLTNSIQSNEQSSKNEKLSSENNYDSQENYIKFLNTSNVTNMSDMFYGCNSLISLPDISKWNTSNIKDMNKMFYRCNSLISLPDISKWDTSNVNNINLIFYRCNSLISLPDISKWNTSNVTNMSHMFYECSSIISLPDISKWNTSNVTNILDVIH